MIRYVSGVTLVLSIIFSTTVLHSQGIQEWVRHYGTSEVELGFSLCVNGDGSFVLAGVAIEENDTLVLDGNYEILIIKVDANGNPIWQVYQVGFEAAILTSVFISLKYRSPH